MEYAFQSIEQKWKQYWKDNDTYKVSNNSPKPKFYILDMFPYPSGAGLHVGHPLGYIASDIYARYKRLKGFNVLHPMGFDAFGLPAEQYALETGQHPADTTEQNIARYKQQLDNIGFCYDWSREVRTSDKNYYKWTQWIFLQLFHSWYDRAAQKARPIKELIEIFEQEGNVNNACPADDTLQFDASVWKAKSEREKRDILMGYRLAFLGYAEVWWCEGLGTVLANDEVVNGVSERGGFPAERKKMRQWFLRITEYADRLLSSLDTLDWTDAMKEMQRNWIGKSVGAELEFPLSGSPLRGEGSGVLNASEVSIPNLPEDSKAISPKEEKTPMPGFGYAKYTVQSAKSFEFAKAMRKEPTEAENLLWKALKNRGTGYKFRRQHPIESSIADFVCLDTWLIVEVDGGYHNDPAQKIADGQRDNYLKEIGFTTLRFTNEEVTSNLSKVIEKIKATCNQILADSKNKRDNSPSKEAENENQHEASHNTTRISHSPSKEADDESQDDISHNTTRVGSPSPWKGEAGVRAFTTRPDTIFGVDFMVLAPEHELVNTIVTEAQREEVAKYNAYVKTRSERERMSETKQISGAFTGAYVVHPFTGKDIPVWISEYVLAGYGTGAIMAVPSGDTRDHAFAKHFNIPITNIFGDKYNGEEAYTGKDAVLDNSGFLTGMSIAKATETVIEELENEEIGTPKVNFKMRDAGFSRQRYWGEPFPIVYVDDVAYAVDEAIVSAGAGNAKDVLPVELPMVKTYKPGPDGQGPLANITEWVNTPLPSGATGYRETSTMPGYAGSSWYFLRYMDPHNESDFAAKDATDYWREVDIYIGGTEHAVGHLLYSRLWTKVLHDLGHISFDEPFKKLVNQGMIQGKSYFADSLYAKEKTEDEEYKPFIFSSESLNNIEGFTFKLHGKEYQIDPFRGFYKHRMRNAHLFIDAKDRLTESAFRQIFALERKISSGELMPEEDINRFLNNIVWEGKNENGEEYIQCTMEIEKMSKSKYNVVNPDDIVAQYGADTFRMYEMFLGPIDVSKPWDTKGIEGVHRFLKKMWRLYNDEQKGWVVTDEAATDAELRILHKTIKKIGSDIEQFSLNTSVSQFMICVNELATLNCHKRAILEPLAVTIAPFAPHFAEELWHQFGHTNSVLDAGFPEAEEKYLVENSKLYPVAINGKTRMELEFPLDMAASDIEQEVLNNEAMQKWMEGKPVKKFIFVKGKMINVVV